MTSKKFFNCTFSLLFFVYLICLSATAMDPPKSPEASRSSKNRAQIQDYDLRRTAQTLKGDPQNSFDVGYGLTKEIHLELWLATLKTNEKSRYHIYQPLKLFMEKYHQPINIAQADRVFTLLLELIALCPEESERTELATILFKQPWPDFAKYKPQELAIALTAMQLQFIDTVTEEDVYSHQKEPKQGPIADITYKLNNFITLISFLILGPEGRAYYELFLDTAEACSSMDNWWGEKTIFTALMPLSSLYELDLERNKYWQKIAEKYKSGINKILLPNSVPSIATFDAIWNTIIVSLDGRGEQHIEGFKRFEIAKKNASYNLIIDVDLLGVISGIEPKEECVLHELLFIKKKSSRNRDPGNYLSKDFITWTPLQVTASIKESQGSLTLWYLCLLANINGGKDLDRLLKDVEDKNLVLAMLLGVSRDNADKIYPRKNVDYSPPKKAKSKSNLLITSRKASLGKLPKYILKESSSDTVSSGGDNNNAYSSLEVFHGNDDKTKNTETDFGLEEAPSDAVKTRFRAKTIVPVSNEDADIFPGGRPTYSGGSSPNASFEIFYGKSTQPKHSMSDFSLKVPENDGINAMFRDSRTRRVSAEDAYLYPEQTVDTKDAEQLSKPVAVNESVTVASAPNTPETRERTKTPSRVSGRRRASHMHTPAPIRKTSSDD